MPLPRATLSLFAAAACLMTAAAGPAGETFTREDLDTLLAQKAAAEAALSELEAYEGAARLSAEQVDSRLLAAGQESLRREAQAMDASARLAVLRARQAAALSELSRDTVLLDDTLARLVSASRRQPPPLLVSSGAANDAVRQAILMGGIAPELAASTVGLARELDDLARTETEIERQLARLEAAEAVIRLKTAEIEQLAAARRERFQTVTARAGALREEIAVLGAEADTLEGFLRALEASAPPAPGAKPALSAAVSAVSAPAGSPKPAPAIAAARRKLPELGSAKGRFVLPVSGKLVRGHLDPDEFGNESNGLVLEARAGSQVVAPAGGVVLESRPWQSYGPTLILSVGSQTHLVLAGLGDIHVGVGDEFASGQPLGRLPEGSGDVQLRLLVYQGKDLRMADPAPMIKTAGTR